MSKISVFKFNLDGKDKMMIKKIVKEYIESKGLVYDDDEKMYTTEKPSKKNDAKNVAASAAATALTGRYTVYYTMGRGIGFEVENNQLIIKACVINHKMKDAKYPIHSSFNNSQAGASFYKELKKELFKKLEEEGIKLTSKEYEKIEDGSGKALAKRLMIIFGCTVAFIALLVMIM